MNDGKLHLWGRYLGCAALFPFRPHVAAARVIDGGSPLAFAVTLAFLPFVAGAAADIALECADLGMQLVRVVGWAAALVAAGAIVLALFFALGRLLGGRATAAGVAVAMIGGGLPAQLAGMATDWIDLRELIGLPNFFVGVAAGLWSLLAQVAATAEVQGFSMGRALVAIIVPQALLIGAVIAVLWQLGGIG